MEGQDLKRQRGFEVVQDKHRTAFDIFTDEKKIQHKFPTKIQLPTRADGKSAGYDFYVPKDIQILPSQKTSFQTDVKAYMQEDEVLMLYIRSSLAIKQGLMLSNGVGVIDASYYNNTSNDGNIGISIMNTSGKAVTLKAGERVMQGIFKKYLIADTDETLQDERIGGIGSSGK